MYVKVINFWTVQCGQQFRPDRTGGFESVHLLGGESYGLIGFQFGGLVSKLERSF